MPKHVAAIIFALIILPVGAQTPDAVEEQDSHPELEMLVEQPTPEVLTQDQHPASNPEDNKLTRRVQGLEDQFEVVRSYNDDFLTIVAWSFGTLAAIAVLLIGFNWFQSARTLRSEFKALREEFEASMKKASNEANVKINTSLNSLGETVKKYATKAAEEKISSVRSSIGALRSEVSEVQYKLIKAEVDMWLTKGVPINAVNVCGELILCAIRMKAEWRMTSALDYLSKSVRKMEEKNDTLEAQDIADFERILDKLPESLTTAREVMRNRLKALHR